MSQSGKAHWALKRGVRTEGTTRGATVARDDEDEGDAEGSGGRSVAREEAMFVLGGKMGSEI